MTEIEIRRTGEKPERRTLAKTQQFVVGRLPFNDVVADDENVAPLHCRIGWNKSAYEVTAATPAGVNVNGWPVQSSVLKPGDQIQIGPVLLVFDPDAAKVAATPEPSVSDMSMFSGEVYSDSNEFASTTDSADKRGQAADPNSLWAQRRPGEQDVLRSPLVLGLLGGGLLLLLLAGVFYALIGRETAVRLHEQAITEVRESRYAQGITLLERFLQRYPRHALAAEALLELDRARVSRELASATPAWDRALENLNALITRHRNDANFGELVQPEIRILAEEIALGSAKTAEQAKLPGLLDLADEARGLVELYGDSAAPPTAALERIRVQTEKAVVAIRQNQALLAALSTMDTALAAGSPAQALQARLELLQRFPGVSSDAELSKRVKAALAAERATVQAVNEEPSREPRSRKNLPDESARIRLTLASHFRSRTDEQAAGRLVLAGIAGGWIALDAGSGEPVWQRSVGLHPPFFPVMTAGKIPGWLWFDPRNNVLELARQDTGQTIWAIELGAAAQGPPLLADAEVFLALADQSVVRLDLERGELTGRVKFAQPVLGPPALLPDQQTLAVVGEAATIYTLSRSPFAGLDVTFTGHAPGSISQPLIVAGRLIVACESDRLSSGQLRIWQFEDRNQPWKDRGSERLPAAVTDAPFLRGAQLVVPLAGERVIAFTLSDEVDRRAIVPVGQYDAGTGYTGRTFVAIGPENRFWMHGSLFRRYEMTTESLRLDQNAIAPGAACQPLQRLQENFYLGRHYPTSAAVIMVQADCERMASPWRTVVGAQPLLIRGGQSPSLQLVTDAGGVFVIPAERLDQGGFEYRQLAEIDAGPTDEVPLRAWSIPGSPEAIVHQPTTGEVWLQSSSGTWAGQWKINQPIVANPVRIGERLIVPFADRLRIVDARNGQSAGDDWVLPAGESESATWLQLEPVAADELVAVDQAGGLRRLQFRDAGTPLLAPLNRLDLAAPVTRQAIRSSDQLLVATDSPELVIVDIRSLDVEQRIELPAAPVGMSALAAADGPGSQGSPAANAVLVSLDSGELLHLPLANGAAGQRWQVPISGGRILHPVISENGALWAAVSDGRVLELNAATGEISRTLRLPVPLTHGITRSGTLRVTVGVDGSLYRISSTDSWSSGEN